MKNLFIKSEKLQRLLLFIFITAGILLLATGCIKKGNPYPILKLTTIATGLKGPIGLEIDKNKWVWVAQSGTGNHDGKVSVIAPNGNVYDVITNFESVGSPGGEPDGPTHLLFADNLLYILSTGGKMYKVKQSLLKPGITTLNAASLEFENIGAFVLTQEFQHPTGQSHPYNLTPGPNGSIYIVDAAANALLKRDKNGVLSVVTEVPGIPNTTPVGPNPIESVPTGIYYNGQDFLVTTLLGFPFPAGKALIYRISPVGAVSVYQQGFTSLVDIDKGGLAGRIVLEHGTFGAKGFNPNTGRLLWANGVTFTVLADGLNQPAGLKQVDENTWYVTDYGNNSVIKVSY